MSCFFCKIANNEMETDIVYEDDQVIAFRDINPQAPKHILIIPRKHIATLNDATQEDQALLGHIMLTAQKIAEQEGDQEDGYRVVMNCNRNGGQSVYHIHLHYLAGRQMGWPPG
ncbi:MAG: histidine triad nucleotide-binding protein [Gammaproteobacteria bacterium]|nr:MAG: histidine triad nucleotide-binding protein [Gammaproteobacteria bacterium]